MFSHQQGWGKCPECGFQFQDGFIEPPSTGLERKTARRTLLDMILIAFLISIAVILVGGAVLFAGCLVLSGGH